MSSHRDTTDSIGEECGGGPLGIDSDALVAALRKELVTFKMELVPAFVSKTPITSIRREPALSIADWQSAADNLLKALQDDAMRSDRTDLSVIDSHRLMRLMTRNGQAWWGAESPLPFEIVSKYCPVLSLLDSERILTDHEHVGLLVPEIKSWMVGLPIRSLVLHNSLSLVLPLLVDHDLEFVLNATTSVFWRDQLRIGSSLSRRAQNRVQLFLNGPIFSHVLNNALLHVISAMANNQFVLIRRLVDHPNLQGNYTGLMLSKIFETLQSKYTTIANLRKQVKPTIQ